MVPLLKKIVSHPDLKLHLLVGGSHLLEQHGNTISEIQNDGFEIAQIFPFLHVDDSNSAITNSMATLQFQMGEYLAQNRPDILLLVGDRFELLPVANTALVLNIPIAHISGGDVTEGAIDNQVRHAISKMSHLHFPGIESSKNNLLKMGEEEWRIEVTGEPGIDCILSIDLLDKTSLYTQLGLEYNKPLVICTFHPETIHNTITSEFLVSLFKELNSKMGELQFLITSSNFDPGGSEINETCIFKVFSQNSFFES